MTDKTMREAVTAHLNSIDPVQTALLAGYVARELKPLATQMGGEVAGQIKHTSRIATNLGREGLAELKSDELAGLLAVASNALGNFAEHARKALGGDGAQNIIQVAKLASAHCGRTKLIAFDIPASNRGIGFGSTEVEISKNMDARLNTDVAEATAFAGHLQSMLSTTLVEEFNKSKHADNEKADAAAQKVVDALGANAELILGKIGSHELHDSDGRLLVTLLNRSSKVVAAAERAADTFGLKRTKSIAQLVSHHVDGFGQTDQPISEEEIQEKVQLLEEFRAKQAAHMEALKAASQGDVTVDADAGPADDGVISAEGNSEGPVDDANGLVAEPRKLDEVEGDPLQPVGRGPGC
ncbi:MAG: hypothetical protein Alpg2KO_30420 [Alphaproteobacteria bacterium]